MQPLLPLGGYAGWRFLSDSLEAQLERFSQGPVQERDISHFRARIGSVSTPDQLVSDTRLLRVALGAFGLQEDLPNRAFIRTVLAEGTTRDDALANRLADTRYRSFSAAFGFGGPLPPRTTAPGFADGIITRFERQEFERAVGEQSPTLRLALTARREIGAIAAARPPDTTAWLTVLGNPPLREVVETAVGLPAAIGTLELDQQLRSFRAAADSRLGSADFAAFVNSARVDHLLRA